MNTDIIVFLGPSLPLAEAKKILPNACYHAPVKCGDILKVLRLKPKILVIIDGFFEQTASVWHKEILLAMHNGVTVYGASSMGALRAAELAPYGMIGVGQIFEWYHSNQIIDDDEVALVHTTDEKFESPLTPMVNVRATLILALKQKVLSEAQAEALLTQLKDQPYYSRSLFDAAQTFPHFADWLKKHYVDQKRLDAQAVLTTIAQSNAPAKLQTLPIYTSVFFNKIFRDMIVAPFEQNYAWLPPTEKQYYELCQTRAFPTIQRIGKLLHLLHDLLHQNQVVLPPTMSLGRAILIWAQQQPMRIAHDRWLKHLLSYSDLYVSTGAPFSSQQYLQNHADTTQTWTTLLTLLNALISLLKRRGASLTVAKMVAFASEFRRPRNLASVEQIIAWMQKNDLPDQSAFEHFVRDMSIVHYFIDHHQGGLLGVETDLTITPWGIEAMALC